MFKLKYACVMRVGFKCIIALRACYGASQVITSILIHHIIRKTPNGCAKSKAKMGNVDVDKFKPQGHSLLPYFFSTTVPLVGVG